MGAVSTSPNSGRDAERSAVAAIRDGDEAAFVALAEHYRRRLQLHCYRMVGSLEDSEDLVQEAILRAWRRRRSFEGRSTFQTWLYRIATNVCLDFLERRPVRELPAHYGLAIEPGSAVPEASELVWLDPYPERLLEGIASSQEDDPEAVLASKETIELAFLAAIQHLPPRQRAVLIVRDVLGWSAKETAAALELSVPSVTSALQRARATLRERLPRQPLEWSVGTAPSSDERALLERYIEAHERGDVDALAGLLRDDVRVAVPPLPGAREGREEFRASAMRSAAPGRFRCLPTRANGRPAAASYVLRDGAYRPLAIDVLGVEDGLLASITVFLRPELFAAFGLPDSL
ncbi:MAG TPA: RNA polymerase subunit sigma-70 [Thermoleophilaceae bacterium]|jgi:RNA polymerase sigma-70 factor (ECF subfamily)